MAENWDLIQGTGDAFTIQIANAAGLPLTNVYTSGDTLTTQIWTGDDQAPLTLAGTGATWADAANGIVKLTISQVDTAAMSAGIWRCRIYVTQSGTKQAVYECTFDLHPSPGTSVAPPTYCTYDDMQRLAPWIRRLVSTDAMMLSSLAEYRFQARKWIDRQIISRVRRVLEEQNRRHAPVLYVNQTDIITGIDDGPWWGESIYPHATLDAQVQTIQTWLDSGGLQLSDGIISRVAALRSIAELCNSQLGDGPNETSFQALAGQYRGQAWREWSQCVARIVSTDGNVTVLELHP
jgi:hypothetical protein